jgi:hypothetical protein
MSMRRLRCTTLLHAKARVRTHTRTVATHTLHQAPIQLPKQPTSTASPAQHSHTKSQPVPALRLPLCQFRTRRVQSRRLRPLRTPAAVTTVNGIACTIAWFHEPACDCVLSTHVPLAVVTERASVHTMISNIPYVISKHYEKACSCLKTTTVPFQVASAASLRNLVTNCAKPY